MQQDWRDALSALSSQLPEDNGCERVPEAETETNETHRQKGFVHIALERKGRAGKTATILYGFTISDAEIEQLAATLKQKLGCGGSVSGGEILLQGDRQNQIKPLLQQLGYKLKP